MKKLLSLLIALTLVISFAFSLSACGDSAKSYNPDDYFSFRANTSYSDYSTTVRPTEINNADMIAKEDVRIFKITGNLIFGKDYISAAGWEVHKDRIVFGDVDVEVPKDGSAIDVPFTVTPENYDKLPSVLKKGEKFYFESNGNILTVYALRIDFEPVNK
ncbi:MAG: hypothetical protein VZQ61_06800 [Christensenellaceae bacterium]